MISALLLNPHDRIEGHCRPPSPLAAKCSQFGAFTTASWIGLWPPNCLGEAGSIWGPNGLLVYHGWHLGPKDLGSPQLFPHSRLWSRMSCAILHISSHGAWLDAASMRASARLGQSHKPGTNPAYSFPSYSQLLHAAA